MVYISIYDAYNKIGFLVYNEISITRIDVSSYYIPRIGMDALIYIHGHDDDSNSGAGGLYLMSYRIDCIYTIDHNDSSITLSGNSHEGITITTSWSYGTLNVFLIGVTGQY